MNVEYAAVQLHPTIESIKFATEILKKANLKLIKTLT